MKRVGFGIKATVWLTLVALAVAYIGWSALRGAWELRALNRAFREEAVEVTGRVVGHQSISASDSRRTTLYHPIVEYIANGRGFRVTAQRGVRLEELGRCPEGADIAVRHLASRPEEARVVGFDSEGGGMAMAIFGVVMMAFPLGALGYGLWARRKEEG